MGELSKLKGLGKKSELCLNEIGIYTKKELQEILKADGVEIKL